MSNKKKEYMKVYEKATAIPEEWNNFCKDNFYMNTEILKFLKKVNNCK